MKSCGSCGRGRQGGVRPPRNADEVGVYDIATATFDASFFMGSFAMNDEFVGAAAAGTRVVLAPLNADAVGVYDIATANFNACRPLCQLLTRAIASMR